MSTSANLPFLLSTSERDHLLDFWFGAIAADGSVAKDKQSRWWTKSPDFDRECHDTFSGLLGDAKRGARIPQPGDVRSSLAYILLCDQLSRNMFRDTPAAFESDPLALGETLRLIATNALDTLRPIERSFALMPLMHSEELSIQELSVQQFTHLKSLGRDNLEFAVRHKAIIDRFGRYPHRNQILGRTSTDEEREFLTQPGSSF